MEKRKIKWVVTGCALILFCSAWLFFFYYRLEMHDRIEISLDSGFYDEGVQVSVKIYQTDTVYYTTDGREPSGNWDNVKEYVEPLTLYADPAGRTYSFRFFIQHEDGTLSEAVERNYVVLAEGRRPEADYVVSVKGDEDALFGYEEGIFVRGRQYDEYIAQNPDEDIMQTDTPANYFADTEVPVHVAVFGREGEEILSQDCGLKIYGNRTRVKNQKSFRLIARYDYDETNEFSYVFFDQLFSDNTGSRIENFQRLSLHNAGNDNGYGFIRNTLCNELARQAGFPDVLVSRSAAVYVNDQYRGVYWLQNTYDDRYFAEKYGSFRGKMAVCEGEMGQMQTSEEQKDWEREAAEEYNDFCSWLRESDINDPGVWRRVTDTIDVENFLQYVAIEYYVDNSDWPQNNVKVYRYFDGEEQMYREGTVFDGRFRYLLFDLDYGMGLKFLGWFGRGAQTEILADLCDTSESASLFARLMEREECRNIFISQVLNLRNGSFSAKNVNTVLEEYNLSHWDELEYMMEQTDILKGSLWESDDNNIDNVKEELEEIRTFAEERMDFVLTEMAQIWDCGALYSVRSVVSDNVQLCIGGQPVQEDCLYFAGIPVELSVDAPAWLHVLGYEVNGCFLEGETVELLGQDYLSGKEILTVVPCVETMELESLSIEAFSVKGRNDWIILNNNGNVDIHLEDYFLSDDEEEPLKGRLRTMILEPGDSIIVYGDKYQGEMDKDSWQVDFSWNDEETVILSHVTEGIVEQRIP